MIRTYLEAAERLRRTTSGTACDFGSFTPKPPEYLKKEEDKAGWYHGL